MSKLKKLIVLSSIISLPISVFFILLISSTWQQKLDSSKYSDFESHKLPLEDIFNMGYYHLKNQMMSYIGLGINSNESLKTTSQQSIIPIKITINDWFFHQKSWNIKKSNSNNEEEIQYSYLATETSSLINNHVALILAQELGLPSPSSTIVSVNVNGVYNGIKTKIEIINESFLKKNYLLEGRLYMASNLESSKPIGVEASIFDTASLWRVQGVEEKNKDNGGFLAPLKELFRTVKAGDFSMIDLPSFAKYSIYNDLLGNGVNNQWYLYHDMSANNFKPIVSARRKFGRKTIDPGTINDLILTKLQNHHEFLQLKKNILQKFIKQNKAGFLTRLAKEMSIANNIIDQSEGAMSGNGKYLNTSKLKSKLDSFQKFILKRFDDIEQKQLQ